MNPILRFFLPPALAGLAITTALVTTHYQAPTIPATLYNLLASHPWLTGTWLALSIIGIDYLVTATRDNLAYRNVGAKSRAHLDLSRRS
ncbi:MAG TPA: hypothetical protein VJ576_06740 [Rhodocyclaceae bacterium]|nr:hypothetical protein [Rhodocyclaceae bacterium]